MKPFELGKYKAFYLFITGLFQGAINLFSMTNFMSLVALFFNYDLIMV